jgi:2-alkyl-3-oxoalkanoate reductase
LASKQLANLLLITGGTGFIGSHVVEKAVRDKWSVRVLARPSSSGLDFIKSLGVDIVLGDITSSSDVKKAMKGVTHVVHCAANVGELGDSSAYNSVNVATCSKMIEAASEEKIRKFVFISSQGVYQCADHFGTVEDSDFAPTSLDHYTISKLESEKIFLKAMIAGKMDGLVLRPGFVYGERDRQVLPRVIEALKTKKFAFIGDGRKVLNNTYVKNLVEAIFLGLYSKGASGEIYNINDSHRVDRMHFIRKICECLNIPVPRLHISFFLVEKIYRFFDSVSRICKLSSPLFISSARFKFLAINLDYSNEKAVRDLGYDPQYSFEDAMTESLHSFVEKEIIS